MQITSFIFGGFVALVIMLHIIICHCFKNDKKAVEISNWVLLISSYIFIIWADYRFAVIYLLLSISTWFFAKKTKYISIGIIVSIIALAVFKYFNFFAESVSRLVGGDYNALRIILPIGISFITFSSIGYLIDVKKGKVQAKKLIDVTLYLIYFPKLTSGPIQNSVEFLDKIGKKRNIGWQAISTGVQIFVFGLFKKIVLADRLSVFVNQIYDTPLVFSSSTVFLATIAYSLQIYFDFSGYSDMAIGVSKMLGIDLPRNFNLPYIAHNVTEFWKRWHISLSSWLQQYLYYSLGGNKKGLLRTYTNLILTMLIGGLWHGANWTYIIWGLLHGMALVIHKVWMKVSGSSGKHHSTLSNIISIIATFLFINFCWIFFRADSVQNAFEIIHRIVAFESGVEQPYLWLFISGVILVIVTAGAMIRSKNEKQQLTKYNFSYINGYYPICKLDTFWGLVVFFVFVGLILCFAYTGGSPFIYGKY